MSAPGRRILIIGCAGAGKSTFAVALGRKLDLPVIHLDAIYWQPGWQAPPAEAWAQTVRALLQRDRWVMDGNYGGTLAERIQACDTVVFLVFSRWLCLYRVFKRSIAGYGRVRPDQGAECPERFPTGAFLWWIWTYPHRRTPKILALLHDVEGEKAVFVLRSPSEATRFLAAIDRSVAVSR